MPQEKKRRKDGRKGKFIDIYSVTSVFRNCLRLALGICPEMSLPSVAPRVICFSRLILPCCRILSARALRQRWLDASVDYEFHAIFVSLEGYGRAKLGDVTLTSRWYLVLAFTRMTEHFFSFFFVFRSARVRESFPLGRPYLYALRKRP